MSIDEEYADFDWGREGNRPFGLSEIQFRLVKGLLAGNTKIAAAKAAGYKITDDNNGRSNASKVARGVKVRAAIAAFQSWQGEKPEKDVDEGELVNLLSKSVRNPTTPGERVQAAALLNKIHDARRERESIDALGTVDLVKKLEDHNDPVWDAIAVLAAHALHDPALRFYRLPIRSFIRLRRAKPKLAESLEHEFGHTGARPDDMAADESVVDYREARGTKANGAAGADGSMPELASA